MPRCAVANELHRGRPPKGFIDLTWIEERIHNNPPCSTAIFVHEVNAVSMATVPRAHTPLGVGFIGTSKFKHEYLGNTYKICKLKVWGFLQWLKAHNTLYKGVSLDEQRMDLYPGAGYLPGVEVEESVIHDNRADPGDMLHYYVQGGDYRNI